MYKKKKRYAVFKYCSTFVQEQTNLPIAIIKIVKQIENRYEKIIIGLSVPIDWGFLGPEVTNTIKMGERDNYL